MPFADDWADYGRDVLQFLLTALPDAAPATPPATDGADRGPASVTESEALTASVDAMPFLLPRLEPSVNSGNDGGKNGHRWRNRRIVLIGHSAGATASINASVSMPRLFEGVVIVDPVINPGHSDPTSRIMALGSGALARRDGWPSREDARAAFLRKELFQRWEPAVLDRYVRFALHEQTTSDDPSSRFRLKCAPAQEAAVFIEPYGRSAQAFNRFRDKGRALQGRILLVLADEGQSVIGESDIEELSAGMPWLPIKRVPDSAHLVAQEQPARLAHLVADFVGGLNHARANL